MKNYSFTVFKGIEKGENRFLYNNRYYLRQIEEGNYINETNCIKMDWAINYISRFFIEDNSNSFPDISISFDKPFDLRKRLKGIVKFRNLNKFEKFLFEYKLKNYYKK